MQGHLSSWTLAWTKFKMIDINLPGWYSISFAAVALVLILLQLRTLGATLSTAKAHYWFLKRMLFPLIVRRWYWSGGTRFQALLVTTYIAINGVCMGLGIHNIRDLFTRSGTMATINMVPLFLGGRTSFLAELMGLSLHSYYLAHHWIGRVAVVQGLIHAGSAVALKGIDVSSKSVSQVLGISAASGLALIMVTSIYLLRRLMYELFLKIHFILAFSVIVAISFHVLPQGTSKVIYPILSLALWITNILLRLGFILYHNTGNGLRPYTNQGKVTHFYDANDHRVVKAYRIVIQLKRRMRVRPGQYVYLFLSDTSLRQRFQAHPFVITWWDDTLNARSLTFLIEPQNGITRDLVMKNAIRRVVIDGPYGQHHHLEDYETVVLAARGIGIAGILPYIRSMVYRRVSKDEDFEAYRRGLLTRKIDVHWVLEENCQEEWVSDWLSDLQQRDSEKLILSCCCFYPHQARNTPPITNDEYWKFIYKHEPMPIIAELIAKQVRRSVGRTKVVVCGDSDFSKSIRETTIRLMDEVHNLEFAEVDYRPEKARQVTPVLRPMTWDAVELERIVAAPDSVPKARRIHRSKSGSVNVEETIDELSDEERHSPNRLQEIV